MEKHIRFDWAIKRLLRQKANFVVLEGFLSELLKQDVTITEILESSGNQEDENDKYNIVDILVKNTRGELMLIEVQNNKEVDYFHRMNYGQAKLLTEHISAGDKYEKIKKVFSINIVYFDLGQGEDYVYKGTTNFVGLHKKDTLQLSAEQKEVYPIKEVADIYTTYYLLKVNAFDGVARDTLDEWIYFLKNSEIRDEFRAKGLAEAKKVMREVNMSPSEKREYERYIKSTRIAHGEIWSARIEGKMETEKELLPLIEEERKQKMEAMQTIRTTVLNLKTSGMENVQIASILGLSVDEIGKIIQEK
ncbi:MAG: Rpn family recombination-promoting nuclease/putative transposase [Bacteroidales bacterium]|nr:Rpn family recombination-promoting nuclease/putative transposase [Bacteroidales bacterium]MCF8457141.1 Rpn family recombination-promoting nuclease/putative transposase [Bacteroidales bacterium]